MVNVSVPVINKNMIEQKHCCACNEIKPLTAFFKDRSRVDGYTSDCRGCRQSKRAIEYANNKRIVCTDIERICRTCMILQPISNYSATPKVRGGKELHCKHCLSDKWYARMTPARRIKYLYQRIKSKCKKKSIPFNLTIEDIIIPDVCPILNIPLIFGNSQKKSMPTDNSPSVDRIIPKLGYVKNNIVIVSQRANRIKNDATMHELELVLNFYKKVAINKQ